jgi:hypothetical protein
MELILTGDLDEKAAPNGSFELNGSAAEGFGFELLNGSGTRYKVCLNDKKHTNMDCKKIHIERLSYFVHNGINLDKNCQHQLPMKFIVPHHS